jgi:hypothetical protein
VDRCLPTSLLLLLLLFPPVSNQLSPQKQKKGELTDIATREMKNKKNNCPCLLLLLLKPTRRFNPCFLVDNIN